MRYDTYQPPRDHELVPALVADLPCRRCGQPPSAHPFDLVCPAGSEQPPEPEPPTPPAGARTEMMYVEQCPNGQLHRGPAWIGRVALSKSGRSVYYRGMRLQRCAGGATVGNHRDVATGMEYWLSHPKRNGEDRHWAGAGPVDVDDDVREEYERFRRGVAR